MTTRVCTSYPYDMKTGSSLITMPELTSLRFFAAWHVVLFHNLYLSGSELPSLGFLRQSINMGFTAVNFFFVLSGFILTTVYLDTKAAGNIDKKSFWVKRLARIYPLFLFALILDAPRTVIYFFETSGAMMGGVKSIIAGTANIMLIQSWIPQVTSSWNSPGWSLSNEFFFYLLFPIVLPWITKGSVSRALKIMMGLFLLSMFLILPFVLFLNPQDHPALFTVARFYPLLHLPEFLFGIALGSVFRSQRTTRFTHWLYRWGDLIALILLLMSVGLLTKIPILFFHNGLLVPIYGLFIFSAASGFGFFSSILRHRFLVFLGNASYAVYILHQPLKSYLLWSAEWLKWPMSPLVFWIYLSLVFVMSILVYVFIEEPARKYVTSHFLPWIQRRSLVAVK